MVCIYCGSPTQVTNSRPQQKSAHIWRRRKCATCGITFTTREQPDLGGVYMVKNSGGHLTHFSRDRLFMDIYASCKHRQAAIDEASALTQTIIDQLGNKSGVIERDTIIATAIKALERFDKTASTVYAAYHRPTDS